MSPSRRILLFTGDGKGKTTAALGMALRAAGHGMRVLVIQFIKNESHTGERMAISHLPQVDFLQVGRGFVPAESDEAFVVHREAARRGLTIVEERLKQDSYALIVLDEICTACALNLIKTEDVLRLIGNSPPEVIWVLTGRSAPEALIEAADTVTVMACRKHGLLKGFPAQKGLEY
jgi:cob(I)alamin adenosyltransferase